MKTKAPQNTLKWLLLFIMPFLMCIGKVNAQSTMGTDFLVSFLPSYDANEKGVDLSLIVAGPRPCVVTVTNPYTGWSEDFDFFPGDTTKLPIPTEQAYSETGSDVVLNIGLRVSSTDTISLFASNYLEHSFDLTNVLPVTSLGSEYMIQSYAPTQDDLGDPDDPDDFSEFTIVAAENNTQVTITLTNNSAGHAANEPFTVTLNEGECYQVLAEPNNDFSGSLITVAGEKKVAVFSGNYYAKVPSVAYNYGNHIFEQMMPNKCWGQQFVITNSMMRSNDIIRITALYDNCRITTINDSVIATINAGETHQFEILSNTPSVYIETSRPAMTCLYLTGNEEGGVNVNGNPSMVIISPIEQMIDNITFSTFSSGALQRHFVNIITESNMVSGMQLDGNLIPSQFFHEVAGTEYKFARIELSHGSFTLSNTNNGGFVAHVYGLGEGESYAYSVGSMAISYPNSQITVNGHSIAEYPNGFYSCTDDENIFELNPHNYQISHVDWNFGDGINETSQENTVTHSYSAPGDYTVSCDIYTMEEEIEILVSTQFIMIHVGTPIYTTITVEPQCDSIQWNDTMIYQSVDTTLLFQNIYGCDSIVILHLTVYHSETTYLDTVVCDSFQLIHLNDTMIFDHTVDTMLTFENESNYYCDSIVRLHLTVNHSDTTYLDQIACGSYTWYDSTYFESGEYSYLEQTVNGCDSLLVLNLTIKQNDTTYLDTVVCDSFQLIHLNDTMIFDHTVDTMLNFTNIYGCDSIVTLHLTCVEPYSATIDTIVCDSYHWNDSTYTQSVDTTLNLTSIYNCDSIVTLKLTVNHTPDIVIEGISEVAMTTHYGPFYVYHINTDTVDLTDCTVDWHCSNSDWVMIVLDTIPYECKIAPITLGQATLTATTHCLSGCDSTYTFEINATHYAVGEKGEDKVLIFPNPASNQVTIQAHQLTHVRLFDCFGQALKEMNYNQEETTTIDVGHLSKGIYLVEITTTQGKTLKRLIIQ